MNIDALVFGSKEPVRDTPDGPAYDAPLRCRDFAAALPLLQTAVAREDARAMGCYGALCATGQGVEKDLCEAYGWFLQAANRGDVPAQVALGLCLAEGLGAPMNRTEAANWLYRAGMAGNRRAIEALEALTMKDCSVIGPHFTEAELIHLLYTFKKARGHQRSVLPCRGERL